MKTIGRNDPCPCGSGKKYKKCCMLKEEIIDLGALRYDKYLAVRGSAVGKMLKLADSKIGINPEDVLLFLTDSPIFDERNIDSFSNSKDDTLIVQYLLNSLLTYAYPVDSSGSRLWEHCLSKYRNKFNEREVLFLQSLKNLTGGFFQAKKINPDKYSVIAEDIFTLKTYKIMDKGMSSNIVKNDIFSGFIVLYDKDSYILEGGSPIIFPPMKKGYIKEMADTLYVLSKSKLRGSMNEKLSRFLNQYPVSMYKIVLDYYYLTLEAPMPKVMTTDNEELVFSKTFYKLTDKQEVKNKLLAEAGFTVSEETKKEIIISWRNKKDTVLGTAFLNSHELRFETNSNERLEKWESIIKNIPIEFVSTESTDFQSMMEERLSDPDSEDKNLEKGSMDDIPEEALKDFALDYWNKYYDEWVDIKIPFLNNMTPLEAIKTDEGKQKVIDLIDDYENKDLHMQQRHGGGNMQKFFNADELRKRLDL